MKSLFLVVFTLLPIINPIGLAPIYLGMTAGWPEQARTSMARRIGLNTLILLVAATFLGSLILRFFGLSLDAVRIGGGLLVASTGWRLLRSEAAPAHENLASEPTDEIISSRAFYPLTFPLTCGPGSISVAITLGAGIFSDGTILDFSALITVLGLLLVSGVVYLCYRSAPRLVRLIGETGSVVMLRLSAFILLCLGVQILLDAGFKILKGH
ncbi:MarC family protein [Bryobacter aggregatus]|uniref:MarC family protein n=1 Tax=Bryobacter aggregatus TaxID=360054 RepID=UPI00068EDFAA|nr:MarC family protein [Bryobacter aggregatus]